MGAAVLFTGPTLPLQAIIRELGVPKNGVFALANGHTLAVRPPVSEGDIVELVERQPTVIAILDGYFENVPAVWHKEILFAMSQGIHVMGASSMGALRAAELGAFGMQGVGRIYESYVSGKWEDDDEVTVAHGPAELGFPAVSEAMANIRSTFDHSLACAAMTLNEWVLLTSIAKRLYYKDRSYLTIFRQAVQQGMDASRATFLNNWVVENRRDQKLADALDLIDTVAKYMSSNAEKKKVLYRFEDTIIWRRARSLQGDLSGHA